MTRSDRTPEVPVVIAGAGPAGLVAAITLARNGIGSLLVERNPSLSPLPRATGVSVRTMELLRSWDLEGEVRAGQLDLADARGFATGSLASPEGTAVPAGFPDFQEAAAASPTTAAAVPQDHLEPVLLGHLRGLAGAKVRFGTELTAFDQDGGGVTVTLRERASGAEELVRAGWLVGADGAHSRVRTGLGIAMDGPGHLAEQLTVLFEAPLARVVGDRRYGSEHGRCPAAMATPAIRAGTAAVLPQALPDTSAVAVRDAVQVPDTADRRPRPVSARRVRWLQEPVAGQAATGRMQPALVDATKPGGQAAAELATDIAHRRADKRAGLLEAEVVELQPGHLAVLPATDDRLGDLVGGRRRSSPRCLGARRAAHRSGRP
jgi:2-polyprenyl-6-methoxyphenol hydroxylase-like FAD-dependent oxidoreductase